MGPIPADCRAVAIVAILWLGFALLDRRWRIEPRLRQPDDVSTSERVVVVVPARNEAQQLPRTLPSLLAQDHPHLSIVVVDDHSDDGTGAVARRIAKEAGAADRVTVITPPPLPAGWTGKVWAQHHGVERALAERPDWIWLTDADVRREPDGLRRLLATARAEGRDLVSVMARLHCETLWERLLIPAFTYFFAALYPFPSVGHDGSRVAGAAGGCMLVRREVIQRIGGMGAIREAVIDDVSFGRACKAAGARLWLGYHPGVESTRRYDDLQSIWNMVARTAYTQLGYRPLALIGCVLALVFLFFVPVFAVLFGSSAARVLGAVALAAMVRTYAPMVRHLRAGFVWALTLPAAVALYTGMTISSAWRHHSGAGATWKGRAYHAGG
ncbi:MAG: glycosyltransferase [Candidatus Binatia bacterium]